MRSRTPPAATPLLALLTLFALLALTPPPVVSAQDADLLPEYLIGRYLFLSTDAPITRATSPAQARHVRTLLRVMRHVDDAVTSAVTASLELPREREDMLTTEREDVLTTCNHREDTWKNDVGNYFQLRGWARPDDGCVSDVYGASVADGVRIIGNESRQGFDKADVFDAVLARSDHLASDAPAVKRLQAPAMSNWTAVTRARGFQYTQRTQTCEHDYASFVRLNRRWYLASTLTNVDKDLTMGPEQRLYAQEYVRVRDDDDDDDDDNDKDSLMADPATMTLLVGGTGPDSGSERAGATTLLATLSGSVPASGFGTVYADENIAVQDALRQGEHATQQADDATTPSNIAILALPLAMNLVPVALVADVNTAGTLLYTLLTDVLTAVPLAIKGVEVLTIGSNARTSVVTRVTGAQLTDDDGTTGEKAGEIWVARCVPNRNLRPIGIVLLVVAMVAMVGGVMAEFVARAWVKRRGKAELVVAGVEEGGQTAATMLMARGGAGGKGAAGRKAE